MRGIAVVGMLGVVVACSDDPANASGTSDGESSESSSSDADPSSSGGVDSTGAASTTSATATTSSSSGNADSTDSSTTVGVNDCGNGVLDPGEECDDDDNQDGDGCSSTCTIPFEVAWTLSRDGGQGGTDSANGVFVDESGTIYVAGSTAAPRGSSDVWLQAISSDGDVAWDLVWDNGNGMYDGASAITRWGGDLVIVGGSESEASGDDALIMRVDIDTQVVTWTATFDGSGSGAAFSDDWDRAIDVALDPHGNLVVAGYVAVDGEQRNAWIAEVDADGVLSWEYAWDDGGDDIALSVAVDGDGNSFSLVRRLDDLVPVSIIGLDDAGAPFDVDVMLPDADYWDLASLPDGGVMLAGIDGIGTVLSRFDDAWIEQWTEHGTTGLPFALAVDASGRAYMAGQFFTPGSPDAWVGGFHADGTRWWSDSYDNPDAHDYDGWNDIAVAGDDVVVVGSETTLDEDQNALIRKYRSL